MLRAFETELHRGLSAQEAAERRKRFGVNALPEAAPVPIWKKVVYQFRQWMIWLLIAAAVISGILGDWIDCVAILAIVALNVTISLFQEEKAGRALAALRKLSPPIAKVVRGGLQLSLPARELVPGDVIELAAGDNIPADARLIQTFRFQVEEAALTGESVPVEKDAGLILSQSTPLAERRNMVFMGTLACAGKASAVVVATGTETELGSIAGMLDRFESAPTPLERRLTELGKFLMVACLVIVAVIFLLQLVRGGKLLEVLVVSISLAVAAVPEGMPAVVTLTLALGLQRMVRRNAIVRKLASVETLGSVAVICTDKTGTLTRNELMVQEIVTGTKHFRVTGSGYRPKGQFLAMQEDTESDAESAAPIDFADESDLLQALTIGAKCNHAQLRPPTDVAEDWQMIGDPTEGALLVAALKADIEPLGRAERILYEIPFDSERKAMSLVLSSPDGAAVLYAKGAPEVILARSVAEQIEGAVVPLSETRRRAILQSDTKMAARALRVLAVAYRPLPEQHPVVEEESDLIFAGLFGMIDAPRDEVCDAVRKCHAAGIRPIMITGDHPATALTIGRALRLAQENEQAVTGQQLDEMSDAELKARCEHIPIYARVTAEHKMRIVRAWQKLDRMVAMTGDGVNDAPAVKAADVGIAMGRGGSDVTKEAADIVLVDNNFASIVSAIEEGRGIYDNIQKFVHYLLACNAGEVLLMFVAALLDWPVPLSAIQILWINLVTDGLPALALAPSRRSAISCAANPEIRTSG